MLPLKSFALDEPANLNELRVMLTHADAHTKFLAGGTDLLPNLKHGLYDINRIISLKRLRELRFVDVDASSMTLGSLVTLQQISEHETIKRYAPAIAKASAHIASPQIRNMGTVGGNICLDTRCLYFNQTEFWRSALGYCLKKDGCACHVVKTGKRCVAAASNDLATALLAYNATISVMSPDAQHTMTLDDFYTANGEKNNNLAPGTLVTDVTISIDPACVGGFYKVRMRESIDFPLLSVAVSARFENDLFVDGTLVINALVAKPKVLDLADFANTRYNQDLIFAIADFAQKKCHPQTNIAGDTGFRKHMVGVAVMRAFHDAKFST